MTSVALLGTGTMGAPMARNLLGAGFPVRVWNRTRAKAAPLSADGATVAETPAEAARGADVLITMLLDAPSTVAAGEAAVPELAPGAVWVQMGTIGLAGLAEAHAAAGGVTLVDAPVLGTKLPAERGELVVLAAGPTEVRDRVQPLFDAIGQRTLWLGEDASAAAATRLKLVVNNWILTLTNAVGEAMALAGALGVDPADFLSAIGGTATDSAYAQFKGSAIINGDFTPSFALHTAGKDAELVAEAAGDSVRLDLADAVRERFRRAEAAGHGDEDMAAAYFASFQE
ncbi:NAD(P)-dependent oxidoreductase [Saccharopolyspora spinosa]|uniref:3-hydroxyisobutyrate dehydrogenase n=1 Tax=Saccharopolyspora spinosa TaxID=60894 RepID=A0A2N3XYN9_SACSN|nr:NAD(P)-dependent oxidoreductase [Saccharopolyspora spinosa]PKW15768.1 3-hydroxyisobutyrate dehydrogenase [Saccharopolyspora spinosa]